MSGDKFIWSVGGGKGGIGKSIATANIGCVLAGRGESVILVDADLGGANLHTYFGIKYPTRGLEDFLKGRYPRLADVALETPVEGLRLISGGGEFLGIANPAYSRKQKLIRHIKGLDADHIIVDLGAGSSYNVLDFFAISTEGIVVLAPEPAAVQNAYVFLKSFVYRRLARLFSGRPLLADMVKKAMDARSTESVKTFSDLCEKISRVDRQAAEAALAEVKSYRPRLLLNMAVSDEDMRVVEAFKAAALAFLSLETEFIGALRNRSVIKAAARRMRPFMLDESAVEARQELEDAVSRLLAAERAPSPEFQTSPDPLPPVQEEVSQKDLEEIVEGDLEEVVEGDLDEVVEGDLGDLEEAETQEPQEEVFGYNDNVNHKGGVFHVQTEAHGGAEPTIETVIYQGGRIFFSKRTLYNEIAREAGTGDSADGEGGGNGVGELPEFTLRQHRAAMAAVKMNKIKTED